MPAISVTQQTQSLAIGPDGEKLRATILALTDALQAVAAKLDADAGVTDTNYAATVAAIVTD